VNEGGGAISGVVVSGEERLMTQEDTKDASGDSLTGSDNVKDSDNDSDNDSVMDASANRENLSDRSSSARLSQSVTQADISSNRRSINVGDKGNVSNSNSNVKTAKRKLPPIWDEELGKYVDVENIEEFYQP
jgi:hypothetical protein